MPSGGGPLLEQAYPFPVGCMGSSESYFNETLSQTSTLLHREGYETWRVSNTKKRTFHKGGCGVYGLLPRTQVADAKTSRFVKHDRRMTLLEVQEDCVTKHAEAFASKQMWNATLRASLSRARFIGS
jgi:hypothetical protein